MQLELPLGSDSRKGAGKSASQPLYVGNCKIPLQLISNQRARRYILRLQNDGSARVTVPRRGSAHEAVRFALKHVHWLEKQWLRQVSQVNSCRAWRLGTNILFRGETVRLEAGFESGTVRFGSETLMVTDPNSDLRPAMENHLHTVAKKELSTRTFGLAGQHGITIHRVSVRNQSSRWGSCSRRGTISLNWRLVQTPVFVRDYIILHELAHVKEMNHSRRFWQEVERLCPDYAKAERWLRRNSALLR